MKFDDLTLEFVFDIDPRPRYILKLGMNFFA